MIKVDWKPNDKEFPIHITINGLRPQKLTFLAAEELLKKLESSVQHERSSRSISNFVKSDAFKEIANK